MNSDLSRYSQSGRPIKLRLGASLLRGSRMYWMLLLVIGLPLLVVIVLGYTVAAHKGASTSLDSIIHSFWKFIRKDSSMEFWFVITLIPVAIFAHVLQRFSYIKITASGIEGYIPKLLGLGLLGLSAGHWRIPWGSIRSIHLVPPKKWMDRLAWDLKGYRLVIETDRGQTRVTPFSWVLRDGPDHRLTFGESVRQKTLDAADVIERAPLVQVLRERGIELSTSPVSPDQSAPASYDLSKHRGLVVQLVLFFAAGLYALVDALIIASFMAVEPLPLAPFVIVGLAATVLVFILGKRAPPGERIIVGMLTVAALTAAVYPGMLRINALTADPQEITYRARNEGVFASTKPGYPELDLRGLDINEYWSQYPKGKEHPFILMRGAGGFYQLDLSPLYKRTRDFYDKR